MGCVEENDALAAGPARVGSVPTREAWCRVLDLEE
jgi:hypothetical protein